MRATLISLFLVLLVAGGCGLFDIRSPVAPPTGAKNVPRANPTDPESTLVNVETSVRCRTPGLPLYEESLAAAYRLVLDQADALQLGTGVTELDKAADTGAQRILSGAAADSFAFVWDRSRGDFSIEPSGDNGFLYRNIEYLIQFVRQEGDSLIVNSSLLVRGVADITIREDDSGNWVFEQWNDGRLPNPAANQKTFGLWHAEAAVGS